MKRQTNLIINEIPSRDSSVDSIDDVFRDIFATKNAANQWEKERSSSRSLVDSLLDCNNKIWKEEQKTENFKETFNKLKDKKRMSFFKETPRKTSKNVQSFETFKKFKLNLSPYSEYQDNSSFSTNDTFVSTRRLSVKSSQPFFNSPQIFNPFGVNHFPVTKSLNLETCLHKTPSKSISEFNLKNERKIIQEKIQSFKQGNAKTWNKKDNKFKIELDKILSEKDKRTTLMIRNIPNRYDLKTILNEFYPFFKNKFDVFYLPIDFKNKCNIGYAFINFVNPLHILPFYEIFNDKKWPRFNSDKICQLSYAKFQGKEELLAHFDKGSIMKICTEDKRPVILEIKNSNEELVLPMKYLESFKNIYPYANISLEDSFFRVNSFYW